MATAAQKRMTSPLGLLLVSMLLTLTISMAAAAERAQAGINTGARYVILACDDRANPGSAIPQDAAGYGSNGGKIGWTKNGNGDNSFGTFEVMDWVGGNYNSDPNDGTAGVGRSIDCSSRGQDQDTEEDPPIPSGNQNNLTSTGIYFRSGLCPDSVAAGMCWMPGATRDEEQTIELTRDHPSIAIHGWTVQVSTRTRGVNEVWSCPANSGGACVTRYFGAGFGAEFIAYPYVLQQNGTRHRPTPTQDCGNGTYEACFTSIGDFSTPIVRTPNRNLKDGNANNNWCANQYWQDAATNEFNSNSNCPQEKTAASGDLSGVTALGSAPVGVGIYVQCRANFDNGQTFSPAAGSYCYNQSTPYIDYNLRINIRKSQVTAGEEGLPTVTFTNKKNNGWYQPGAVLTWDAGANDAETGIRLGRFAVRNNTTNTSALSVDTNYINNGVSHQFGGLTCDWAPRFHQQRLAGGGNVASWNNRFYTFDACGRNKPKAINGTSFTIPAGTPSGTQYTATATGFDTVLNSTDDSDTFRVDGSIPFTPGDPTMPGCPQGIVTAPADYTGPRASGGANLAWWAGDGKTVTFCHRDDHSGVASITNEYRLNGGAWQSLSGCSNSVALPAVATTIITTCTINTTQAPWNVEGQTLQVRSRSTDGVGFSSAWGESAVRAVDNTGPTVTLASPQFTDASEVSGQRAPANGGIDASKAQWTNRQAVTVLFAATNNNQGSGVTDIYARRNAHGSCAYRNALDGDTSVPNPGKTTPQAASGGTTLAFRLAPTATQRTFTQDRDFNDPAAVCAQGRHDLRLWAKDQLGNVGTITNALYRFDTIPPGDLVPSTSGTAPVTPVDYTPGPWTLTWRTTSEPGYNANTHSPLDQYQTRLGEGTIVPLTGTATPVVEGTNTPCFQRGVNCISQFNVSATSDPGGGAYPLKVFVRDEAGNAAENRSADFTIKYSDGTCVR